MGEWMNELGKFTRCTEKWLSAYLSIDISRPFLSFFILPLLSNSNLQIQEKTSAKKTPK